MFDGITEEVLAVIEQQLNIAGVRFDIEASVVRSDGTTEQHHVTTVRSYDQVVRNAMQYGDTVCYSGEIFYGDEPFCSIQSATLNVAIMKKVMAAMMKAAEEIAESIEDAPKVLN